MTDPSHRQAGESLGAPDTPLDPPARPELALAEKTREFEAIFHALPDAVVFADDDGRIRMVNPAFTRIFGFPADEVVGGTLRALHGSIREYDTVRRRQLLGEESGTDTFEAQYRRRSGESVLCETVASRVRARSGGSLGELYIMRDVSARRQAEEALRVREERLRLACLASETGIWDWDLVTNRVLWTETQERLFGLAPGTFPATYQATLERVHPEDRARQTEAVARAMATRGEYDVDFRIIRPDGELRWIESKGHFLHDASGRPVRMVGTCIDVTERKTAEQGQRLLDGASGTLASALGYEARLNSVARYLVPALGDWCLLDVLEEDGSLRRFDVATVPGHEALLDEVRAAVPKLEQEAHPIVRAIRTGEPQLVSDTTDSLLRHEPDAAEHLALLQRLGIRSVITVPLTARGRSLGAVTLFAGGSGRRYGPRELTLAVEIGRRAGLAIDNARLFWETAEANEAKSRFLQLMSRELRTPLNAIVGFVDLLLAGVPAEIPEASRDHVQRVRASAWAMLQLIEELLDFARMEAGREDVMHAPADVTAVVRDVATLLEPVAAEQSIELDVHLPPTAVIIETDGRKMRDIVLNVLTNAIKRTRVGAVSVELVPLHDAIEIRVHDTGAGVPADLSERIFEPFWQHERREEATALGTGLALSVARRLARMLGGDVTVTSGDGGTTFTVKVPRQHAWRSPGES